MSHNTTSWKSHRSTGRGTAGNDGRSPAGGNARRLGGQPTLARQKTVGPHDYREGPRPSSPAPAWVRGQAPGALGIFIVWREGPAAGGGAPPRGCCSRPGGATRSASPCRQVGWAPALASAPTPAPGSPTPAPDLPRRGPARASSARGPPWGQGLWPDGHARSPKPLGERAGRGPGPGAARRLVALEWALPPPWHGAPWPRGPEDWRAAPPARRPGWGRPVASRTRRPWGRTRRDAGRHALLVEGLGLPGRSGPERWPACGRGPRHRRGDGGPGLARPGGAQPRAGALPARPAGRPAEEGCAGGQVGGECRQSRGTGFRATRGVHRG